MASSSLSRTFPWGNVLFSLALAGAFLFYAHGVYADARRATDWMLVIPVAGIGIAALTIGAGTKVIDWYRQGGEVVDAHQAVTRETLLFIVLLALYVALLPVTGFDLGSMVFVALALYLQGERRGWRLLVVAALVATGVTLVFVHLLNVRLPTLLF
ncbi:tripartite tricarboxylate transporter TctB family protein [Vreelandella malpeensis]|uniref:Tripartite tricarboxylate transporter TctB family protein n=1 Tax=Vreelandella malpeensis TaxID=1172368 RepID=A0ABS8DNK0_9GAMM|nr:tripartite tricarboxylate transporter TctB family protein [Halomonas malpeensis]MCB8887883.1 tripartite tricarboxylate transporter TctB family protein [Halomonas malpeensis]